MPDPHLALGGLFPLVLTHLSVTDLVAAESVSDEWKKAAAAEGFAAWKAACARDRVDVGEWQLYERWRRRVTKREKKAWEQLKADDERRRYALERGMEKLKVMEVGKKTDEGEREATGQEKAEEVMEKEKEKETTEEIRNSMVGLAEAKMMEKLRKEGEARMRDMGGMGVGWRHETEEEAVRQEEKDTQEMEGGRTEGWEWRAAALSHLTLQADWRSGTCSARNACVGDVYIQALAAGPTAAMMTMKVDGMANASDINIVDSDTMRPLYCLENVSPYAQVVGGGRYLAVSSNQEPHPASTDLNGDPILQWVNRLGPLNLWTLPPTKGPHPLDHCGKLTWMSNCNRMALHDDGGSDGTVLIGAGGGKVHFCHLDRQKRSEIDLEALGLYLDPITILEADDEYVYLSAGPQLHVLSRRTATLVVSVCSVSLLAEMAAVAYVLPRHTQDRIHKELPELERASKPKFMGVLNNVQFNHWVETPREDPDIMWSLDYDDDEATVRASDDDEDDRDEDDEGQDDMYIYDGNDDDEDSWVDFNSDDEDSTDDEDAEDDHEQPATDVEWDMITNPESDIVSIADIATPPPELTSDDADHRTAFKYNNPRPSAMDMDTIVSPLPRSNLPPRPLSPTASPEPEPMPFNPGAVTITWEQFNALTGMFLTPGDQRWNKMVTTASDLVLAGDHTGLLVLQNYRSVLSALSLSSYTQEQRTRYVAAHCALVAFEPRALREQQNGANVAHLGASASSVLALFPHTEMAIIDTATLPVLPLVSADDDNNNNNNNKYLPALSATFMNLPHDGPASCMHVDAACLYYASRVNSDVTCQCQYAPANSPNSRLARWRCMQFHKSFGLRKWHFRPEPAPTSRHSS